MAQTMSNTTGREEAKVDFHYCPKCGFRMSDVEFMFSILDFKCPGRGDVECTERISSFLTEYKGEPYDN